MPFIRISLRAGKPAAYRKALSEGVYAALRETFTVPEDDFFAVVHEHDEAGFAYGRHYFDIARDDDLVFIEITVSNTRGVPQKQALFAAIARNLVREPGLRPENVFATLVEVEKENWSFGHGLMQYGPIAA